MSIDGRGARRTNTVSKYLYQSWSKWREENQAEGAMRSDSIDGK
ncbi:hypothetical protein [Gracilibacillus sp. Marseille-QA3620]